MVIGSINKVKEDTAVIAKDPSFNILKDVNNALAELQLKYTNKKALCLNLGEGVKAKRVQYKQALDHGDVVRAMYQESLRTIEKAKGLLEQSEKQEREICTVAKGLRLYAEGPIIFNIIKRSTAYDYRE